MVLFIGQQMCYSCFRKIQKCTFTFAKMGGLNRPMDVTIENQTWEALTYKEKNHQLFLREKALLAEFLEHGAISQAQHDKSLHDLIEKMGESE